MAAIICESLSKILRGTCEALGTVLTLPCKVCGLANGQLANLCRSPFCLYLCMAIGLNLPPIIFAGKSIAGKGYGSQECISASNWLYLNSLLCFINIAMAFYLSIKITYETSSEQNDNADAYVDMENNKVDTDAAQKPALKKAFTQKVLDNTFETDTRSKSVARVKDILCYDPIVAVYIIIGIFYMCWQTVGAGRTQYAYDCGRNLDEYLSDSLLCGFLFIMLGGMTFGCSVCCLARS